MTELRLGQLPKMRVYTANQTNPNLVAGTLFISWHFSDTPQFTKSNAIGVPFTVAIRRNGRPSLWIFVMTPLVSPLGMLREEVCK